MLPTRLALLLAATTTAALVTPASAAAPDPLMCTLADDRITESSGVVVSSSSDRRMFTHNDSGDDARFFAVDDRCRTTATYALTGVDSDDWEDVARGPDENGEPVLWFGDIGDNAMMREQIQVYRVAEPRPGREGGQTQEVASTAFQLRYEDRAHDAETLLADPRTGQLFVVTKTYGGLALVYAAPPELRADEVNVLTRVGQLLLTPTGTPGGPFGPFGQLSTTGGDVSPSGDRVVIRTYSDAYEWAVDGDLGQTLTLTAPRSVTALPETAQGEAVSYSHDGQTLIVTSEGKGAPVHRVASAL